MNKENKIAKIILGAKNKDLTSIEKIVEVYSVANVDMLDVCADKNVIETVLNCFEKIENPPKLCVSITLQDDVHLQKTHINKELCVNCNKCQTICPQNAIEDYEVKKEACIGCLKCLDVCPVYAINAEMQNQSFEEQFNEIKNLKVDCIEIHTNGKDESLFDVFEFLKVNFKGDVGICIAKNENIIQKREIVEKIKKIIFPKTLIVQADGSSISGFDNEIETTKKAVNECKNFSGIDDIILIASGGTNFQTALLMRESKVHCDGIAWGSFARKLIYDYVYNKNMDYEFALQQAKKLVCSLKN